jgi:hypothetical protein
MRNLFAEGDTRKPGGEIVLPVFLAGLGPWGLNLAMSKKAIYNVRARGD